jgi:hypothetical protein
MEAAASVVDSKRRPLIPPQGCIRPVASRRVARWLTRCAEAARGIRQIGVAGHGLRSFVESSSSAGLGQPIGGVPTMTAMGFGVLKQS